ncbi:hypothetical protein TOPH_07865 [Tolypocladium ophioglossoides CBS 100239]|uniref:Uncharacterized protein n=1 Tax=Tolypocladium ophioglossoides (strain CBS 100239) TaxID=1163406 RepID=A0A0L0N0A2_TOLOC|nr:hypothetical protein TOPH_07865 [Tolypocladium ophioglossoides CBS 100239]
MSEYLSRAGSASLSLPVDPTATKQLCNGLGQIAIIPSLPLVTRQKRNNKHYQLVPERNLIHPASNLDHSIRSFHTCAYGEVHTTHAMPSQQASQAQASNGLCLRDAPSEETLVDNSKTMPEKLRETNLASSSNGGKTNGGKASHKKPKADPIRSWEARVFAALSR